jgi:magnesium chelatase subunit D
MSEARPPAAIWADAINAAALLAVDPVGLGGVAVRAPAGEVREAWLQRMRALLPASPIQIPADVTAQQLLGGLDLERTLSAGRPILQTGALARADGGLLTITMAERLSGSAAALVASAMDRGRRRARRLLRGESGALRSDRTGRGRIARRTPPGGPHGAVGAASRPH